MDMNPDIPRTKFGFGEFTFDPRSGELFDGQKTALLRPQVAKLLTLLLSNANNIVSREEIRNCLWGSHTIVEFEEGISACMRQLRVVLNDGTTGTRYIQTISRRGYKFVYPVTVQETGAIATQKTENHQAQLPSQLKMQASARSQNGKRWLLSSVLILFISGVAGVLAVAHYKYRVEFFTRPNPAPQNPVIAVLPFTNLSTNAANTVLGASIASELIDLLGPIAPTRLGVIADTSTMHYAGNHKTIKTIGQELGANYVLEGAITQDTQSIHISARLITTADQSYVWGDEYDLDAKYQSDKFQQVVVKIAAHLASLLAPDASIKPLEFTSNRDAAFAYQLGRYLLVQGDYGKARDYCEKSITLDPGFAAAYTCTARALMGLPSMSVAQVDSAKKLVQQALRLNSESSEAHLLQGSLDLFYDWNPSAAEPEISEALRHNPGNAWAWQAQAAYYSAMGENLAMRRIMATAQDLDPVSMRISSNSAVLFYIDRQYDRAEQYARTGINLMPDNELARHILILTLLGEGRYADSVRQAVLEMQYLGATPADITQVQTGNKRALVSYFNWYTKTLVTQSANKLTSLFLADAYMHLGQPQRAFAVLNETVKQHEISTLIPFMSVWPSLHPLCKEAKFASLTHQLGQTGCTLNR
jgi:TolB-like protein/DNA-binding winged helix-turn-helix (wHTH) protein